MIMKNAGFPAEEVEQENRGNTKKQKPYPVQDEDTLSAPEDDSADIKYLTKKNKK